MGMRACGCGCMGGHVCGGSGMLSWCCLRTVVFFVARSDGVHACMHMYRQQCKQNQHREECEKLTFA